MVGAETGVRVPVLFTSGYYVGTIATRGVLEPEIRVIEKPFPSADLMSKVRKLLPASTEPDSELLASGFKEVWLAQSPRQL